MPTARPTAPRKTLGQAIWQITVADVSMSLDNVLAVAGAAREHPSILIFGLVLSIALMGLAASFIAQAAAEAPLDRLCRPRRSFSMWRVDMIYRGAREVWPYATAYARPGVMKALRL